MYYTLRDLEKSVSGPEPAVCGSGGVWDDPLNDNVVEVRVHPSNDGQPQNLRSFEDGDGFLPTRYNNCTETLVVTNSHLSRAFNFTRSYVSLI